MAARGGSAKASVALSLGVLAVLALMAWSTPPPQPIPRPVSPPAPRPETKMPSGAETPAKSASLDRPVVLPPPPETEQLSEAAKAQAPPAAARPAAEAAPRQVVKALTAEPSEPEPAEPSEPEPTVAPKPEPRAVKQITALRARPEPRNPAPPDRTIPAPVAPETARRAPEPKPEPALIRHQAEPATAEPATAGPATEVVAASEDVVREGRTLLRLLEHGSGPDIELAWPDSATRRARLYRRLRDCYGVRVALMDGRDRLFAARGTVGAAWNLNLDRYSGFIRRPAGRLAQGEAEAAARIRAYHGELPGARPVRVFPRRVDALLLGGLNRIVGPGYADRRTIRARYRLDGARLLVERVEADGHALPGRIDLSTAAPRACRNAAS